MPNRQSYFEEFPKIGDDVDSQVYELVLSDHIVDINPDNYQGVELDIQYPDPKMYFITSGDAVEKAKVLDKEMWSFAGAIRKKCQEIESSEHPIIEYESIVWRAAGQTRKMLNALIKAKGDNIFLETEFDSEHRLLCLCKNPRNR